MASFAVMAESTESSTPVVVLEHAIGFSAKCSRPLHLLRKNTEAVTRLSDASIIGGIDHREDGIADKNPDYVVASGSHLILSSFGQPHEQEFLRGHVGAIVATAISKDQSMIASAEGGLRPDVFVWQSQLTEERLVKWTIKYRFEEHRKGVAVLCFSDDNRLLVTIGTKRDGRLLIWDLCDGNLICTKAMSHLPCADVQFGGRVKDVKRRPTADHLFATCGFEAVVLWAVNPETHALVSQNCQTKLRRDYTCVQFSPGGDLLVAGTSSGDFVVFNTRVLKSVTNQLCCVGGINALAVLPLAGGSAHYDYGSIDDIFEMQCRIVVGGGDAVVSQWLWNAAASEYDCVDKLSVASSKVSESGSAVEEAVGRIMALSVDQSGERMVGGTDTGRLFRIDSGKVTTESMTEPSAIQCVRFAAMASDRFLTCASDGQLKLWNVADYSVAVSHSGALPSAMSAAVGDVSALPTEAQTLCADLNDELIVVGYECGDLRAFNSQRSNDSLWQIRSAHKSQVTALRVAANHKYVLSGDENGALRIWDMRYRNMVANLKQHRGALTAMALYSDARHVVTGSRDRSVICWDLADGQPVSSHRQPLGGINAMALSADESLVITVSMDRALTFWDLRQKEPAHRCEEAHGGNANAVAVSTYKGTRPVAATVGDDCLLKLWDLSTRKLICENESHSIGINDVVFSSDGRQVVTGGKDANIMVWNIY